MNGFKRMQSKIWGDTALLSFDGTPLLHSDKRSILMKNRQNSYYNFGHNSDTDSDKSITSIHSNTGFISAEDLVHENKMSNTGYGYSINNNDFAYENISPIQLVDNAYSGETISKPFSLLNYGHGSLDSGFSDSENPRNLRNDETANNLKERRRRRRKRSRERGGDIPKLVIHELPYTTLLIDNIHLSNPSHTSTPKRNNREVKNCRNFDYDEKCVQIFKPDTSIEQRIIKNQTDLPIKFLSPSNNAESLSDFLYSTEPLEDDDGDVLAASTSSTSRHSFSFIGPYYTRISSESNFKSISRSSVKINKVVSKEQIYSSVKTWLKNLMQNPEYECYITLQSKSLPKPNRAYDLNYQEQENDLKIMTAEATAAATKLIIRANDFMQRMEQFISEISHQNQKRINFQLLEQFEKEALLMLSMFGVSFPKVIYNGDFHCIMNQLKSLNNTVNHVLNTRLDFYIMKVVRGLEDAPKESGSITRGALAALTALGLAGTRAGNSIARCSGVRALLTLLISACRMSSELRASTLRALTSVCCCSLAIDCFVKEGGLEILMDILIKKSTPESEKMEAIALIVQITAPWVDAFGLVYLEPFSKDLIYSLMDVADDTSCVQTLLLCAAALNNLGDSKLCSQDIMKYDSVWRLLQCVKKSSSMNISLMEQVVLLINKLAKTLDGQKYLAKAKASVALISFLRMIPPGCEKTYWNFRIEVVTALTNLCVNEEIAKQVAAVGGSDFLAHRYLNIDNNFERHSCLLKYSESSNCM